MKILMLTSIYPQQDDDPRSGVTPVVQYFIKEWVKSGHEIIVVHNANKYPLVFYLLPEYIRQYINAKLGMLLPEACQRKSMIVKKDGVLIARLPILKFIPHGRFAASQLKHQLKKIIGILEENNFTPDVILGHWENPQLPLAAMLKDVYKCKTAIVFHSPCKKWNIENLERIDVFGCRSKVIAEQVKVKLNLANSPFICYSGIPDIYLEKVSKPKTFSKSNITKFLFVGQLFKRKYVDSIIRALYNVYPDKQFSLTIVGIGAYEKELKTLVKKLDLQKQIRFLGRVPRDEIMRLMQDSQCFTMISKDEAFGLVYLEAMANGCIVVASKDEGIDGVIIDGINGFLCTAGDVQELTDIYRHINTLGEEEKEGISQRAIATANHFKDSEVAKRYLDQVMNG